MSKLVRLNSETSTIKRTWQGAPVSFSCFKKNCSSWCKQAATVWSWTHSLLCSQTGKREYGNFSFLPHTRRGQSPPSQWLHDPNLSPIHIYVQHPSWEKKIGFINNAWEFFKRRWMTATNYAFYSKSVPSRYTSSLPLLFEQTPL